MSNVPDRYTVKNSDGLTLSSWRTKKNAISSCKAQSYGINAKSHFVVDSRNGEVVFGVAVKGKK